LDRLSHDKKLLRNNIYSIYKNKKFLKYVEDFCKLNHININIKDFEKERSVSLQGSLEQRAKGGLFAQNLSGNQKSVLQMYDNLQNLKSISQRKNKEWEDLTNPQLGNKFNKYIEEGKESLPGGQYGGSYIPMSPANNNTPTKTSTKPTKAPTALDITASTEGGGRYDLAFGDTPQKDGTIKNVLGSSRNFPKLQGKEILTPEQFSKKPLTEMTLAEVLQFQNYRNSIAPNTNAVGKYQFMRATLFGFDGKSGLVGKLKLPMNTIFNADTQELLQATMRKDNAAVLEKNDIIATDANLNLANAVGAQGVVELLKPENANRNALDVLGYSRDGAVAQTNKQLNKLSKDVVAETYSKYDASGMAPGGSGRLPSGPVMASASAPSSKSAAAPNLKMPTMGTLAAAAPTMGDMIEAATSAFSDITRVFDTAMASVTNVTNNNTQSSAGGQQAQGALPSVYDDVFLSLFQRVT
jgi:hypothetical protein